MTKNIFGVRSGVRAKMETNLSQQDQQLGSPGSTEPLGTIPERRRAESLASNAHAPGSISELSTPALLLDRSRLEHNASRMRDKVRQLGVTLRPHVKTSKSIDVLRVLAAGTDVPITVSTLAEARYFFARGVADILYAVGIAR